MEYSYETKKPNILLWIGVIFAAIIVILIIVYFVFYYNSISTNTTDATVKVVDSDLSLLKGNKIQDGYNALDSGFKSATTYNQFLVALNKYPSMLFYDNYTVNDKSVSGTKACVILTLNRSNNTIKLPVFFGLTQTNNEWKILNIKMQIPSTQKCSDLLK